LSRRGAPHAFAPWRPWLGDEGDSFPYLRVRGPVALVNLSSAEPTPLLLAQGRLGAAQIEAARALLADAAGRGLYRILLVHHPVAPGVVDWRKELVDADAVRAMLADVGAELVLHGHAHKALLTTVPGPAAPIPVLAVPAASTPAGGRGQAARWNEIAITRDGAGFRTEVSARGVTRDLMVEHQGTFVLV
jgi:3',5'-cyclic AMP phosphodiesterase CpdA